MKKAPINALTLRRETLRPLNDRQTSAAAGGVTTTSKTCTTLTLIYC